MTGRRLNKTLRQFEPPIVVVLIMQNSYKGRSTRRKAPIHFDNHTPNSIAKLFNHVLVAGQCVTLCVVEDEGSIRVANVVQSDVSMEIWIQRAN